MSRLQDAFDNIALNRDSNVDRIVAVIESALTNIRHVTTMDGLAGDALRMRGAAVLLLTAAQEVATLSGRYELAHEVGESGILDEEDGDG